MFVCKILTSALFVGYASAFRLSSRKYVTGVTIDMTTKAKSEYLITLLPGDGIGPEIVAATVPVLNAVGEKQGYKFKFQEADCGGIAIDRHNDPFPAVTLQMCQKSDSVLLGAVGGYKWDNNPRNLRPETGLLAMRKTLGLFANLRPAKVIPQLIDASTIKKEVIEGVDIMIVRELTGGIYFGQPKGIETNKDGVRYGYSTGAYTEPEVERIAKVGKLS